jgi:hypothetical protein
VAGGVRCGAFSSNRVTYCHRCLKRKPAKRKPRHMAALEFTYEQDGLAQSWACERVWCNPPYSDIEPWVAKARIAGAELVVMLLPANRTEQGWWQRQVEPFRDRGRGLRVEFLPGRPRFIRYGHDRVEPNQRPPFGCCLLIWGDER